MWGVVTGSDFRRIDTARVAALCTAAIVACWILFSLCRITEDLQVGHDGQSQRRAFMENALLGIIAGVELGSGSINGLLPIYHCHWETLDSSLSHSGIGH